MHGLIRYRKLGLPFSCFLLCIMLQSANAGLALWDDSFRTMLTLRGTVANVACQLDGKILIQGDFQWVGLTPRKGLARLLPDGSVDPTFDPASRLKGVPVGMAMQADGKSLVALQLTYDQIQVVRLNPDSSLDSSFVSSVFNSFNFLLPLPSGYILVVGAGPSVERLLANGNLDPTFDAKTALASSSGPVIGIGLDGDSGYLVAIQGPYSTVSYLRLLLNGQDGSSLPFSDAEKLRAQFPALADGRQVKIDYSTVTIYSQGGVVESTWNNNAILGSSRCVAVQPDGKLLVPGFGPDLLDGRANFGLLRLQTNGVVDPEFSMPAGISVPGGVDQVRCQPDGSYIVRGQFTLVNGIPQNGWARLTAAGNLDSAFGRSLGFDISGPFDIDGSGRIITGAGICPTNGGPCRTAVVRFSAKGEREIGFESDVDTCETIQGVYANGDFLLVLLAANGGCWSQGLSIPWFRLVNSQDGGIKADLELGPKPLGEFDVNNVLQSRVGGTYILGQFCSAIVSPSPSCVYVLRLQTNGIPDPNFQLSQNVPTGYGILAGHIETDGGLTLLTTSLDHGDLLLISTNGVLLNHTHVQAALPRFAAGAFYISDNSWLVASVHPGLPSLQIQRISAQGQSLVSRTILPGLVSATFLDSNGQLLVSGSLLDTPQGSWSGLLRLRSDALTPTTVRLDTLVSPPSLIVDGPADQQIRLETSTDLTAWKLWTETSISQGHASVPIPQARGNKQFFIRVTELP